MKFVSSVGSCIKLVRSTGLLNTITQYWDRLRERLYERYLGIRSEQIISLKEIGLEHNERRECAPTGFDDFRCMKKFLVPETPNEVFIDYGAGLGRVLVLAAMLPFKRVIGIEISPVLVERARTNLSRCRGKLRCKDVEVLTLDATTFEVPTEATTIYFNNPFAGKILAKVLDNIRFSYEKRPRRIRIVCNLPRESAFGDQMCKADNFTLQHEVELGRAGRRCLVFSMNEGRFVKNLTDGSSERGTPSV